MSPMLYTKLQGHCQFGSGEEEFQRVFTIYERGGQFGHVTKMRRISVHSPYPVGLQMKFGFDWPSFFSEEKTFEEVSLYMSM